MQEPCGMWVPEGGRTSCGGMWGQRDAGAPGSCEGAVGGFGSQREAGSLAGCGIRGMREPLSVPGSSSSEPLGEAARAPDTRGSPNSPFPFHIHPGAPLGFSLPQHRCQPSPGDKPGAPQTSTPSQLQHSLISTQS